MPKNSDTATKQVYLITFHHHLVNGLNDTELLSEFDRPQSAGFDLRWVHLEGTKTYMPDTVPYSVKEMPTPPLFIKGDYITVTEGTPIMYVSGLTKDKARSEQTLRVMSIIVNGNDTYTYKLDDYDGVGGLVDIFVDEKDLTITFVQPQ